MDDRFPKYIQFLIRKLNFIAIPNWNILICGLAVLAFMFQMTNPGTADRFMFDAYLILEKGEWFRLFAFPTSSRSPVWFLIFVMFTYFVVGSLESEWGAAPLTIYILSGYLSAVAAGFLLVGRIDIWNYILMNTMLAFGTIFPNYEILIFFILPVKMKYLAMLTGAFLVLQMISGPWQLKLALPLCMAPYILFFSPMLIQKIKNRQRKAEFDRKYDKDMWR